MRAPVLPGRASALRARTYRRTGRNAPAYRVDCRLVVALGSSDLLLPHQFTSLTCRSGASRFAGRLYEIADQSLVFATLALDTAAHVHAPWGHLMDSRAHGAGGEATCQYQVTAPGQLHGKRPIGPRACTSIDARVVGINQ